MYAWDLAMVTVSFSGLKKYSQEVAEGGVGARGNSQVLDAHGTLNKWHGQAKNICPAGLGFSCRPRRPSANIAPRAAFLAPSFSLCFVRIRVDN